MASRNMDYEKLMSIYNSSLTTLYGPQRLFTFDDSKGGGSSSGGDKPPQPPSLKIRFKFKSSEKEGIKEDKRERITTDLRIVNDKMRETTFGANDCEVSPPGREVLQPEAPGTTVGVLPWNLRKKRSACQTQYSGIEENKGSMRETMIRANALVEEKANWEVSPPGTTMGLLPWNMRKKRPTSQTQDSGIEENKGVNERIRGDGLRKNQTKLCITLSKQEIEEDFMKMLGHKPPRKPKNKRSKTLQDQIDLLNPGSYLSEITEDRYDVLEPGQKRKR